MVKKGYDCHINRKEIKPLVVPSSKRVYKGKCYHYIAEDVRYCGSIYTLTYYPVDNHYNRLYLRDSTLERINKRAKHFLAMFHVPQVFF